MTSAPKPADDDGLAEDDDDVANLAGADVAEAFSLIVDDLAAGQRLDAYLAAAVKTASRSHIRRSIDQQRATVNGVAQKPSYRVAQGDRISLELAPVAAGPQPDPIPLELLYEDESLAVVNKAPGMVVHPAKGHWSGTLAGALVHRFGALSGVGGAVRPGIVHRLDRDTSGVIVVAKTDAAHHALAEQFQNRTIRKQYLAIVAGSPDRDADRVDLAIGPHPTHREKMALRTDHVDARPAETFVEVIERYPGFAFMRALPKTGRTHQIRLHLAHLRCPVLCDKQYGSRSRITLGEVRAVSRKKHIAEGRSDGEVLLVRQALHAHRLTFQHPSSGAEPSIEAPLPDDMERVLSVLRETRRA